LNTQTGNEDDEQIKTHAYWHSHGPACGWIFAGDGAQNGAPTGGYPPVMGGAGGNPAVSGSAYFPEGRSSYVTSATEYHHPIKHHKKIYMSAKARQ
jgi:hypothetical protein